MFVALSACGSKDRRARPSDAETSEARRSTPQPGTAAAPSASASSATSALAISTAPRPARAGLCAADGALAPNVLRAARIDLHTYARLLGAAFDTDVVVTGELPDPSGGACPGPCLDLEGSATTFTQGLALAGAHATMRRGAALISDHVSPKPSPLLGASRDVDLHLGRVSTQSLADILSAVSKRKINGMPDGELTVLVHTRPALDVLALLADVAGTTVAARGTDLEIAPGGVFAPARPVTVTVPKTSRRSTVSRDVMASDEPIESMRVVAVVSAPGRVVRAVLQSPGPDAFGWIVKVGDYVGKARLSGPDGAYLENARVERIHCTGVDVRFGEATSVETIALR